MGHFDTILATLENTVTYQTNYLTRYWKVSDCLWLLLLLFISAFCYVVIIILWALGGIKSVLKRLIEKVVMEIVTWHLAAVKIESLSLIGSLLWLAYTS